MFLENHNKILGYIYEIKMLVKHVFFFFLANKIISLQSNSNTEPLNETSKEQIVEKQKKYLFLLHI
jgi:hypothetical protein